MDNYLEEEMRITEQAYLKVLASYPLLSLVREGFEVDDWDWVIHDSEHDFDTLSIPPVSDWWICWRAQEPPDYVIKSFMPPIYSVVLDIYLPSVFEQGEEVTVIFSKVYTIPYEPIVLAANALQMQRLWDQLKQKGYQPNFDIFKMKNDDLMKLSIDHQMSCVSELDIIINDLLTLDYG